MRQVRPLTILVPPEHWDAALAKEEDRTARAVRSSKMERIVHV
jgi:hypothetical protein